MEEVKRKRKRKRIGKSVPLPVDSVGLKSKSLKGSNGRANSNEVISKKEIAHARSTCQNTKNLKRNRNKNGKKRRRAKKLKLLGGNVPDSIVDGQPMTHDSADSLCTVTDMTSMKEPQIPMMNKLVSSVRNGPDIHCRSLKHKSSYTQTKKLGLKEKLQNKLESGRFRWINEKLYTTNSLCAFKMFREEPELFDVYHQGFSGQVQKWPVNPVDEMIKWIRERSPQLIIADMGCGEAKISQNVPNKVFSFDLVAGNDCVIACDMAKVPLGNESVDVVIYCLSLMGTNLNEFLQEAHRILKKCGILKIAEVVSRFECLNSFEEAVCSFGFQLIAKDTTNKMFVQFDFEKLSKKPDQMKALAPSLKPCLYKKR